MVSNYNTIYSFIFVKTLHDKKNKLKSVYSGALW